MSNFDQREYARLVEQQLDFFRNPPKPQPHSLKEYLQGRDSAPLTIGMKGIGYRDMASVSAEMTVVDNTGGTAVSLELDSSEEQPVMKLVVDDGLHPGRTLYLTDLDFTTQVAVQTIFRGKGVVSATKREGLYCDKCSNEIPVDVPVARQHDIVLTKCGSGHPQAIVRTSAGGLVSAAIASSTSGAPVEVGGQVDPVEAARKGLLIGEDEFTGQTYIYPVDLLMNGLPVTARPNLIDMKPSPYKAKLGLGLEYTPQAHTRTETVIIGPDMENVSPKNLREYAALTATAIFVGELFEKATKGKPRRAITGGVDQFAFTTRFAKESPFHEEEKPIDIEMIILDPNYNIDNLKPFLESRAREFQTKGLRVYWETDDEQKARDLADYAKSLGYVVPVARQGTIAEPCDSAERVKVLCEYVDRGYTNSSKTQYGTLELRTYRGKSTAPIESIQFLTRDDGSQYISSNRKPHLFVLGRLEVDGYTVPIFEDGYFGSKKWSAETGAVRDLDVLDLRKVK